MKKKILTHTFNGIKMNVDLFGQECDGIADCPYGTDTKPAIRIFKDLYTKAGMETLFHEMLHELRWAETEDVVDNAAREMAKLAWRIYGDRIKQ